LTDIVALGELSDTVLNKIKSAAVSDSDYDVRIEANNALSTLLVEGGGMFLHTCLQLTLDVDSNT
jgi:hypothetical protein